MPVLTLGYRHCDRKRPSYIKNSEIEGIAVLARQQLVDAAADAISLATLSAISGLKINGVVFDLFVGAVECACLAGFLVALAAQFEGCFHEGLFIFVAD
ncbi:MAG TPA: hypothetical protein PKD73_18820 [Burkholderiaceae bacterium]|nr:hypothetical protein [Burkholderiaceae bacterium]